MDVRRFGLATLALLVAEPAVAQSALEEGFTGALRGCEAWVFEPSTWADGLREFASNLGLGDKAGWVQSVDEHSLPPAESQAGNHYLRINSAANAGYILVVSDRAPFCHITGGGGTDVQPAVEAVLASSDFADRWEKVQDRAAGDMASTAYRSREDPNFMIRISRASKPGERLDRVQVLASAVYDVDR